MINFLKEVKTELAKVVWPSKTETLRYTVTVIAFSLVTAVILGAFDYGLFKLFENIIA
jgi:preprotein translocase subunit SecE